MVQFIPPPGTVTARPRPYGRITNRIIMRGMGPHINRLICQGYGGPPAFVITAILRGIRVGQSGTKRRLRELDPIIVWAKLIEVNDHPPPKKIEGFITVYVSKAYARVIASHVSTRVRKAWQDLKVIIQRIK